MLNSTKSNFSKNLPSLSAQFAKEVKDKNLHCKNIKCKCEILECIIEINKKHFHINTYQNKEVNHANAEISLRNLAS